MSKGTRWYVHEATNERAGTKTRSKDDKSDQLSCSWYKFYVSLIKVREVN